MFLCECFGRFFKYTFFMHLIFLVVFTILLWYPVVSSIKKLINYYNQLIKCKNQWTELQRTKNKVKSLWSNNKKKEKKIKVSSSQNQLKQAKSVTETTLFMLLIRSDSKSWEVSKKFFRKFLWAKVFWSFMSEAL